MCKSGSWLKKSRVKVDYYDGARRVFYCKLSLSKFKYLILNWRVKMIKE